MTTSLRVLLAEDSPTDAKLVAAALRGIGRAVACERVQTAAAMRAALAAGEWDAVISDWSMPGFGALAALAILHESGRDLPFIIVSGTIGEERAVEAMRAGAHDFVLKDRLARLAPALERELRERAERAARRSAEAALKSHDSLFRALIEKSEEGISLSARDGTTLYLSPAADRILGRPTGEDIGRSGFERMHPDDRAAVEVSLGRIAAVPGASATIEFRVVDADGSHRWIEGTGTNMLDDPAVGAVIGNFRDVSARKSALDALRASEERYRRIVETANEGIWVIDAGGRTTFVNARMADLLGRPAADVLGRRPPELLDAEGRALFGEEFPRLREGSSRQVEVSFTRPDGTTVWTLLEATPIFDAQGGFEGALAMAMDVTARRLAEASLRVSEARFQGLWDSGLILAAVYDHRDGTIRALNEAGAHMVGYAPAEVLGAGLRWVDLTPPEWRAADLRAFAELAATGVARPWEKELIHRDGTRVPILAGAARLQGGEAIAIGLDLTERKRAETVLRRTEDQLRHAQKMEAVGRLAGGVAHDFNNLLSVILGYAELALDDLDEGAPLRTEVEEIRVAGERAADLTRQLLMFSRQQVIEPKVIDLGELVEGMEKMLLRLVGEDVEVVTRRAPSLGRVRADPSSIDQVVMNLVVNARDAMPTGGRLSIETADVVLDEEYARAHHGVEPGPHVMLAVGDTGTGMDEATVARIFEPFFTTKEQGKGTGLGLSTVFGIVQQSRGSVEVESTPGRGTTFRIYLPTVDAAVDARTSVAAPGLRHGTETILLVEDEDAVRAVARNILRRHGYTVIEARSAGEALLHGERNAGVIDLLLTDVVMPQMSGPELAQRLLQTRPALRVLCMSGYTDDSVVRHGVLAASLAYLQKPLTPELLTRRVREVLEAPAAVETLP